MGGPNDLQGVLQLGTLSTDTQVVEDGIALLVLELGGVTLFLKSFVDDGEVLTGSRCLSLLVIS